MPKKSERERKAAKAPDASAKSRDAVLEDFRKVAGPLRGRNRDRKPKP